MAKIKIADLHPTGSDLFSDSENFMNELGDRELSFINGGTGWGWGITVSRYAWRADRYFGSGSIAKLL